jgi:hypothetical protein
MHPAPKFFYHRKPKSLVFPMIIPTYHIIVNQVSRANVFFVVLTVFNLFPAKPDAWKRVRTHTYVSQTHGERLVFLCVSARRLDPETKRRQRKGLE